MTFSFVQLTQLLIPSTISDKASAKRYGFLERIFPCRTRTTVFCHSAGSPGTRIGLYTSTDGISQVSRALTSTQHCRKKGGSLIIAYLLMACRETDVLVSKNLKRSSCILNRPREISCQSVTPSLYLCLDLCLNDG